MVHTIFGPRENMNLVHLCNTLHFNTKLNAEALVLICENIEELSRKVTDLRIQPITVCWITGT